MYKEVTVSLFVWCVLFSVLCEPSEGHVISNIKNWIVTKFSEIVPAKSYLQSSAKSFALNFTVGSFNFAVSRSTAHSSNLQLDEKSSEGGEVNVAISSKNADVLPCMVNFTLAEEGISNGGSKNGTNSTVATNGGSDFTSREDADKFSDNALGNEDGY